MTAQLAGQPPVTASTTLPGAGSPGDAFAGVELLRGLAAIRSRPR